MQADAMLAALMPLHQPATWDDLLDVPDEYIGEIIDGKLVMSPRPGAPHAEAASDFLTLLNGPFRFGLGGPGGWRIIVEPLITFGSDLRVPDLAGWRNERYQAPENGPYTVTPDWIGEVLSPSTEKSDREDKLKLYAQHSVNHVWLIHPTAHTLEIFRTHHGEGCKKINTFTEATEVRAEPFDAIALDLALIWPKAGATAR